MHVAKQRGHGEGSIYQRADGRWEARVTVGYVNGKRKRKSFYGDTRAEVRDQLLDALNKKKQGLPVAPDRQTVEQFLTRWLADVVKPSVRPRTHDSYSQLVR